MRTTKLLVFGHRGSGLPENTLSAFDEALIKKRADGVEVDAHPLADSDDLAVIHDATVDRTTNGRGFVREYTPESIKRLTIVGSENVRVPLLSEVFQRYRDSEAIFNVELKEAGIAHKTFALVRRYDAVERAIISAFHHDENDPGSSSNWEDIFLLSQKEPEVLTALLSEKSEYLYLSLEMAKRHRIYSVHPNLDTLKAEGIEKVCEAAHALKARVIPYESRVIGENARKDDALIALIMEHCDGIITDHIEWFRS